MIIKLFLIIKSNIIKTVHRKLQIQFSFSCKNLCCYNNVLPSVVAYSVGQSGATGFVVRSVHKKSLQPQTLIFTCKSFVYPLQHLAISVRKTTPSQELKSFRNIFYTSIVAPKWSVPQVSDPKGNTRATYAQTIKEVLSLLAKKSCLYKLLSLFDLKYRQNKIPEREKVYFPNL